MSSNETTIIVTSEEMTLSRLIWIQFKRKPHRLVEKVLERNPGLAENAYLPLGTRVVIPLDEIAEATPAQELVRLFD